MEGKKELESMEEISEFASRFIEDLQKVVMSACDKDEMPVKEAYQLVCQFITQGILEGYSTIHQFEEGPKEQKELIRDLVRFYVPLLANAVAVTSSGMNDEIEDIPDLELRVGVFMIERDEQAEGEVEKASVKTEVMQVPGTETVN